MDRMRLLSIGECMVELSPARDGLLKPGFAGDTFNTAWYARQLLGPEFAVDYFTATGNDDLSERLIGFMHQAGIGVGHIRIVAGGELGLSMVEVDAGGESIIRYWRKSAAARRLAEDAAALRAAIGSHGHVHFSGITLAILPPQDRETLLAELRRAKAAGATVSFDANIRPALWESRAAMVTALADAARASTLVFPALAEEQAELGAAGADAVLQRYAGLGAGMVVLNCGANGVLLHHGGQTVPVPAAATPGVVDTTAAGDSFAGTFIAGLMMGAQPEAAARNAAIVAAEVMAHPGALVPLFERAAEG